MGAKGWVEGGTSTPMKGSRGYVRCMWCALVRCRTLFFAPQVTVKRADKSPSQYLRKQLQSARARAQLEATTARCALLIQRLSHAAAVVFHQRALHHELNLPVDERRTALMRAFNTTQNETK
jgi:hypothetical protein